MDPSKRSRVRTERSRRVERKSGRTLEICSVAQSRFRPPPGARTTLDKKKNHTRDSRREERCSTCDIMLDQARSAQGKSRGSDLPCADRAWSSMISHVEQRSSRRESRWLMVLFFVEGSTCMHMLHARSPFPTRLCFSLQLPFLFFFFFYILFTIAPSWILHNH